MAFLWRLKTLTCSFLLCSTSDRVTEDVTINLNLEEINQIYSRELVNQ